MNTMNQASAQSIPVEDVIQRSASKMKHWGITVTYLATQLGVSRQYAWQVVFHRTLVSRSKALEVEAAIDSIIANQSHVQSFGDRLRAARISKGLTLKNVAEHIGYSWVGVERWEKNMCLPKPGVLWHLRALYEVDENWMPPAMQDPVPCHTTDQWQATDKQRKVA